MLLQLFSYSLLSIKFINLKIVLMFLVGLVDEEETNDAAGLDGVVIEMVRQRLNNIVSTQNKIGKPRKDIPL